MEKKTRFFRTALPEDWYIIIEDDNNFSISKYSPGTGATFAVEKVESHDVLREEFRIKYDAIAELVKMASLEGVKHCVITSDLDGELAVRTSVDRIKPFDRIVAIFDPNDFKESANVLYELIPNLLEDRVGVR